MSSKKTYFILVGANILIVTLLVIGAVMTNSLLSSQSAKIVKQRLQISTLDSQGNALSSAKQGVAKYQDLSTIAKSIVPQDKDQAQTVREIVKIANTNSISLTSVTFPTSTLGDTGTPASHTAPTLSQLTPVKGITGVYSLEIVVQSDINKSIPYGTMVNFLNALEHNRRTALVSNITLTPDEKNANNVTFSLTLDEYIKP